MQKFKILFFLALACINYKICYASDWDSLLTYNFMVRCNQKMLHESAKQNGVTIDKLKLSQEVYSTIYDLCGCIADKKRTRNTREQVIKEFNQTDSDTKIPYNWEYYMGQCILEDSDHEYHNTDSMTEITGWHSFEIFKNMLHCDLKIEKNYIFTKEYNKSNYSVLCAYVNSNIQSIFPDEEQYIKFSKESKDLFVENELIKLVKKGVLKKK